VNVSASVGKEQAVSDQAKRHDHGLHRTLRALTGRVLTAVIPALLIVLSPAVAQAAFMAATKSTASVGTYTIPAPATAAWTFNCTNTANTHTYHLHITSFATVARADSYLVTITAPDLTAASQTITATTLNVNKASATVGAFTFTIQARVGTWTGAPFSRSDTC
jgi:hypothetical protein